MKRDRDDDPLIIYIPIPAWLDPLLTRLGWTRDRALPLEWVIIAAVALAAAVAWWSSSGTPPEPEQRPPWTRVA